MTKPLTKEERVQIRSWLKAENDIHPGDAWRLLDDLDRVERERDEARARLAEVEASMLRHFQEDHLAGDGPEIDRLKAKLARIVELASVSIDYAADSQAGGWNAAMREVLAIAKVER